MKRITIYFLIATILIVLCGCGASQVSNDESLTVAKQIEELIEMGIPESFILNLEEDDVYVMYKELKGMELGTVKFTETVEDNLQLNMLTVPVCDGMERHAGDCFRIYGTYQWNNRGITLPSEDEMRVTWDKDILLLGDDSKLTRSYKGNADGTQMECYYDESGFADIGQGKAGWYHPVKAGAGKHVQKGTFGILLMPVHTYDRVIPVDRANKKEIKISLEYIVYGLFGSQQNSCKISAETELYTTE